MKIALLDDNPEQLERNQRFLSTLPVEVVTASLSAKAFLQEVKLSKPDVLVLDLNLGDSYMTGMEVAFELKLPVLFASSNTPEYVKEMEEDKLVLYRSLYDSTGIYGRPRAMFLSPVDKEKYPDVKQYWRMEVYGKKEEM